MKKILLTVLTIFIFSNIYAQEADSVEMWIENVEESLNYQTGVIELESGNATLTVPKGFHYLDKAQSIYVLTDLWGNPADSSILGMLVPENMRVMDTKSWLFTIYFEEMGYVKDEDADEIDYDDLLKELQKETQDANAERIKGGYQPFELMGWASTPYYDKDKKILHWAKDLKVEGDSVHTLNYNLRVLGRKGVFILNAIAYMSELPEVKSNIHKVIGSIEYKDGNKYADFIPDVDHVAEWTIGGLVAGKILAKVGFFALIAKFWKVILIALSAAGGTAWKFFKGRKKNDGGGDKEVKEEADAAL